MNLDTLKDLLKQADEFNNSGKHDEAETLARTALTEIENANDSGEDQALTERKSLHCSALIALATIHNRRGDHQAMFPLALASLDIAEEYSLTESKAKAWNTLGNANTNLGSNDKALEFFRQALSAYKELGDRSAEATVIGNIGIVHCSLGAYDKALECYEQALAVHVGIGNISFAARVTGNIGIVYRNLGAYDKALEYMEQCLAMHKEHGDKTGMAQATGNIGVVYADLGSFEKALEFYEQALERHMELGNKSEVARIIGNIGSVYQNRSYYEKALEFYEQALAAYKELGQKSGEAHVTGNIGIVYVKLCSFDKALEFMEQALATHKELGEKSEMASLLWNIGELYANKKFQEYDSDIAEQFLKNAIDGANEIGAKAKLVKFHKSLADLYKQEEQWKEFALTFEKYIELKDELNIEETKKQDAIREQRKIIDLAKAKADAKHQATEQLLHNVLPPSIADKMLDGSKLIAEKLPSVSVLFADIVNFTKLSQQITPEELVEGLDRIFSKFDSLAEKYGLEKIKTIGDAYMVVSGAPVQREDHAEAIAHFALEMMEAMKEFRSISTGEEIQLRIGIHSGEVVAGVIGKKKFAYDLWGDAVNTASRMESHGEPGKIHCTEEFKHAVEALHATSHQFIRRGEMEIKGKGMMKTYFMEAKR